MEDEHTEVIGVSSAVPRSSLTVSRLRCAVFSYSRLYAVWSQELRAWYRGKTFN